MLSKTYKERLREKLTEKLGVALDDSQIDDLIGAIHAEELEVDYADYENFLLRNIESETTLPDRYAVISSKKDITPREEVYSIDKFSSNFESIFVSAVLRGELGYVKSDSAIEDKPLALSCEAELDNETYYNMINKIY